MYRFIIEDGTLIKYLGLNDTVMIPQGIHTIGTGAFLLCINIKSIVIPEGVTEICDKAFYQCERLEEVILPDSVTHIGYSAFEMC